MGPTIQLIQLTLRIERENEAQRRPHPAAVDNFAEELPVRSVSRGNHTSHIFQEPRRPQCECA